VAILPNLGGAGDMLIVQGFTLADTQAGFSDEIGYNPSPEALEQIRAITGNADAEYGDVNGGECGSQQRMAPTSFTAASSMFCKTAT
jgi:hypothetical protein